MNFDPSPEQLAIKEEVATFATTLNADVGHDDEQKIFPKEKWNKCAKFGLHGLQIPKAFGGRGFGMLTSIFAMEGFGCGCKDNGLAFALNAQMLIQLPLIHFGNEQQKQIFLQDMSAGNLIGAFGFTEPLSGSDLYSISTRAEKSNDGYLLNGTKALITFAPIADFAIVLATTNPQLREWGLTIFLVDLSSKGIKVSQPNTKMGLRTVPSGEIEFNNCFIEKDRILGTEGAGLGILNRALEWDRCCVLASQLGAMERLLEESIAYSKQREQFGGTIGKFQSISNRVADMKLRLESSRLLLYKAAWTMDQGNSAVLDSALSKLALSESFVETSLDAIRIHGGNGYLGDIGIERNLRDSIGGIIYGGTSDIQRNTIAKMLGL